MFIIRCHSASFSYFALRFALLPQRCLKFGCGSTPHEFASLALGVRFHVQAIFLHSFHTFPYLFHIHFTFYRRGAHAHN
jgi:hypothetical protein